jgi:hypothetical protein
VYEPEPMGVPAAPNASRVRGRLLSIEPGEEGQGTIWKVKVDASLDVDKLPNFARAHIGKVIEIIVPPDCRHKVVRGYNIEARVAYDGDERGGAFFLIENDVRKL